MDNKLCWLPRYWIEKFRERKDPRVKVSIATGEKKIINAMKLGAKHEGANDIKRLSGNYLYSTYQIDFGR